MSRKVTAKVVLAALFVASAGLTPQATQAQGNGPNLLKNPGFDWPAQTNGDVCAPGWSKGNAITPHDWTPYWACKNGEERNQDRVNRPPEYRVMTVDIASDRVRSYPASASFFTFWALNRSMGLYQIVSGVTPGAKLRFSAWANLLTTDSDELPLNSSRLPGGLQARVCIQTSGVVVLNPNFNDPAIVCGAWVRPYDTWGEMWVEATAAASEVVAIVDTTADYPVKHNDVHVDDASLVVAGQGAAPSAAVAAPVPAPQQAAASTVDDAAPRVSVKTPVANVRAAPSYTGQIIASAPQGMSFVIRAYTADKEWWQIEYSGGQGGTAYIHNSVVDMNAAAQRALNGVAPQAQAAAAAHPAATQAAAPAPAVTSALAAPAQVVVSTGGDRLIIRGAASATAPVIGRVANGASLAVTGVSPDKVWWRITYPGTADGTAWVMAQWVKPNASAQQLASQ
jgi:uncharacterized protein YgiM (DUF1202 family)